MSESIGNTIPPPLRFELAEKPPNDTICKAILLVTVDADGTPRTALLSTGEIKILDARRVGLTARAGTATTENLKRGGNAMLWYVLDAAAYSMRGTIAATAAPGPGYEAFELTLTEVLRDFQAGSPMVAGPTYKNFAV